MGWVDHIDRLPSSPPTLSPSLQAITVARGYISNEGTGHELGFQPYQRDLQGGGSASRGYRVEDDAGEGGGEMAFDVWKVPQMPEVIDAGNLPVKVTAHSR